jgi:DNA-binding response OmpR family regulator
MAPIGRVLIIDDEERLRVTLARVLQMANCEVITAGDGNEAMEALTENAIDMVYSDICLPDMTGLEILKEIRGTDSQLPVILFTGNATLQTALDAIRLGATDYLVKPIDPEVLIARTRVILAEQSIERRKREIRAQITQLQTELHNLEISAAPTPTVNIVSHNIESSMENRFIKRGHFILDLQAHRATLGDQVLSLPPTAFVYLTVLVRHAPEAVDYQTLTAEAQGYEVEQAEASELAKYHIHVLRQALNVGPDQPGYLVNVRGVGYRILTD